jgi:hypothetical protein
MKKLIFLSDIDIQNSPHVRAAIIDPVVQDYLEAYKSKSPMPPPILCKTREATKWWIVDGLHRISALQLLGRKAIECETMLGTFNDALKLALKQNIKHGLRRSNADKQRCIHSALQYWPNASNRQIAEDCGVDESTVRSLRSNGKPGANAPRVGKDGKTYKPKGKQNSTCGIPAPEPEAGPKKDKSDLSTLKDCTGFKIPENLYPMWGRSTEVTEMLKRISGIKCELEKLEKADDPLWREAFLNKAVAELESVYGIVGTALPFAVCSVCNGNPELYEKDSCRGCRGRGFMSKFRWDRVPDNIKKVRAAS